VGAAEVGGVGEAVKVPPARVGAAVKTGVGALVPSDP